MPTDDRDEQFERALAHHLRHASPDSACPDTEILAAYHERTLSLEEMAQWKQHIAGCARCQESLVLLEQTENIPAEASEKEWLSIAENVAAAQRAPAVQLRVGLGEALTTALPRQSAASVPLGETRPRPSWRWLAPLGALAAAIIMSIGVWEVRIQHQQQMKEAEMTMNRTRTTALSQLPQQAPIQPRNEEILPQRSAQGPLSPRIRTSPSPEPVSSQKSLSPPGPGAPAASGNELVTTSQGGDALIAGQQQNLPAAPPPVSAYVAKSRTIDAAQPPTNSGAVAGAVPSPANREKDQILKPPSETVEVQSAAPAVTADSVQIMPVEKQKAPTLVQMAVASSRYIVSPGEKHAWRVGDSGTIEHSLDRGKSWKPQSSGVSADLTSGSATSDNICWIIGKAGTILLTTDGGKHWRQVGSPIAGDLGGIHATDATHASIWDVPNRISFETSDGGATWTRIANE